MNQHILDLIKQIETTAPIVWHGLVGAARAESLTWVLIHLLAFASCAFSNFVAFKAFLKAREIRLNAQEQVKFYIETLSGLKDKLIYTSRLPEPRFDGIGHFVASGILFAYSIIVGYNAAMTFPTHIGNLAYPDRLAAIQLVEYIKKGTNP